LEDIIEELIQEEILDESDLYVDSLQKRSIFNKAYSLDSRKDSPTQRIHHERQPKELEEGDISLERKKSPILARSINLNSNGRPVPEESSLLTNK